MNKAAADPIVRGRSLHAKILPQRFPSAPGVHALIVGRGARV